MTRTREDRIAETVARALIGMCKTRVDRQIHGTNATENVACGRTAGYGPGGASCRYHALYAYTQMSERGVHR